jgi:hypothetical protein
MQMKAKLLAIGIVCATCALPVHPAETATLPDLSLIRTNAPVGFANSGWKYDRYESLPTLDKRARMLVADLRGPGVIRHLHFTQHQNRALTSRGVVLEIWFDDAPTPAVLCPLADFFGDGCNGRSIFFSTPLIEVAPRSYNCWFPMPFKTRARVYLRNDTDLNLMNYSFVEWEPLAAWNSDLGYFHATWRRDLFQLSKDTKHTCLDVHGAGHLIGRHYSIATADPLFRNFDTVMEGNNEVDIDGQERALDYLGTEDSFGFSWGFQRTFAGGRSGMTVVDTGVPHQLSIYRFHDHLPIRFNQRLTWHINWQHERGFTGRADWAKAVADGGCTVDYAMVHYWYQDAPGGFDHAPLPPVAERKRAFIPINTNAYLGRLFQTLPSDPNPTNTFSTSNDLKRVLVLDAYAGTHPFWIDRPQSRGGHPGQPNPGRQGILAVHPAEPDAPCCILWKATLPAGRKPRLRMVVSGDPYEAPGRSDFVLQVGLWDGAKLNWLPEQVISAGDAPAEKNWQMVEYPLPDSAGKTVGLILKIAGGGKAPWLNEEAFLDELSVISE